MERVRWWEGHASAQVGGKGEDSNCPRTPSCLDLGVSVEQRVLGQTTGGAGREHLRLVLRDKTRMASVYVRLAHH